MRLADVCHRNRFSLFLITILVFVTAATATAATITVNDATSTVHNAAGECSLTGTGTCSLADALNFTNADAGGPHTIVFSVSVVNLTVSLPQILKPVTIDGVFGAPRVEIVGQPGVSSFDIQESAGGVLPGSGTTIKNLVIRNMGSAGVSIDGGGNQVLNCYIGTDKNGAAAQANNGAGVSVTSTAAGAFGFPPNLSGVGPNYIGDPADPTSGNLISGNNGVGVTIFAQRTVLATVAWNKIGTDKTGNLAIPNASHGVQISGDAFANAIGPGNIISGNTNANSDGINISGSVLAPNVVTANIIGPSSTLLLDLGNGRDGVRIDSTKADVGVGDTVDLGPGNIIGYNKEHGVMITGSAQKVYAFGNFIGVAEDPANAGTFIDLGNALDGIRATTAGHQIGGPTVPETNVISANNNSGIALSSGATDTIIKGNIIGRDPLNLINFPNTLDGITIANVGNNTIGGTASGEPNVIAGNGRNGIKVNNSGSGWANLITRNSIFENHQLANGLGIDLDYAQQAVDPVDNSTPGPDPNTAYANYGQNAPVVGTGVSAPYYNRNTGDTKVSWVIDTQANAPITLEFFASDAAGMGGNGEGQKYLGTVNTTTDGAGHAAGTSNITPPSAYDTQGKYITMTATNTSAVADLPGPNLAGLANNTSEFSNAVLVPQSANHFGFTTPPSTASGTPFNFTIDALTPSNTVDANYTGTVHFTSSDAGATLPANTALVNGTALLPATLATVGLQTLTGTDTVTAITGTSSNIAVTAGPATHFTVVAPASATAGSPFNYTVTALDASNNTATAYSGTVHFTSTDGAGVLPGDATLVNGVGVFQATLNTTGNQTITATDTVTASITGTSNTIAVSAGAATHFSVTAPATATAGLAFSATVTALDALNNIDTAYAGTVHMTTTDGTAVLPVDFTLTSGVKSVSVTLKTAGNQTITATDTVSPAITGNAPVAVSPDVATHLSVVAPATANPGASFNFNVTALDAFNNTATAYAGTVHFTSSDGAAALPADSPLVAGTGVFSATLNTTGNQTITGTDTVTASINGTSGTIVVSAAAATHFLVSAPATATAGVAIPFTVTAQTAANATATGYSGTVHFTTTDGAGILPADATLVNGVGNFVATLKTAGTQTLTATDTVSPSITGTSNNILVSAAAASHFSVTAPAAATQGAAFNFNVTALDPFNNVDTAYAGTAHFTSTDGAAVLPGDSTLVAGAGIFAATLNTVGNQTLTATDTVTPAITGTSNTIAVSAAAATHFLVTAPASATAGASFNFTVTAQTAANTTATGYSGTVHFTTTDGAAVLPADATLVNGFGTFAATLNTSGNQTITATDTVTPSITGTSNTIVVGATAATHFVVAAPASATAGLSFNFTVTAQTAANTTATGYSGTVHFTATDGAAILPADATLVNGFGTFSATLKTAGTHTLTATDTVSPSITGTSGNIVVGAAAATHFTIVAPASATPGASFNFTVNALDAFNNVDPAYAGTVHFTSTDGAAVLPANSTLVSGAGTFAATLNTTGNQTITGTDTVTPAITGTSNIITVGAAAATHFVITAPASATPGASFNFTITAQTAANTTATSYSGTVHFTSSDGAAVLPGDATLVNGVGTFAATLNTAGNQTISGTDTVTAAITGTSNTIVLAAAVATHFLVTAPASATAGIAFNFTVTAQTAANTTDTGYSGTVHFTSSDTQAVLPANATLTNGVGNFSATLRTAGNQTITATDTVTSSLAGTSGPIAVSAAAATHFSVTAAASVVAGSTFNATVTALDAFNNVATSYLGTVHFTSSDSAAGLPANSLLTSGAGTFPVQLNTAGIQSLTATDTVTASITGTTNVTVTSPGAAIPALSWPALLALFAVLGLIGAVTLRKS